MKRITLRTVLVLCFVILRGSTASAQILKAGQSEISFGWGDQGFEKVAWHQRFSPENLSEGNVLEYNDNYRYTQHWFLNYRYNFRRWLSVGGMFDVSGVLWDNVIAEGSKEVLRDRNHNFYNISIMPTVTFTYFNKEYVSFHSGVGLGVNINTGTELDIRNNYTAASMGAYLNFFGVQAGYKNYFASVDLGGMIALRNMNEVYMLLSRLVSVSVGVKF